MREKVVDAFHRKKPWWVLASGAAAGMILSAFFLPGGDDLYRYYLPFVQSCLDCGFVPYYAQWFLSPLHVLPEYPYTWPLWVLISVLGFLLLAYITDANPFYFLLSFPMLGQIWLGQIDIVICLGMVILLFVRNPYARGFGICLAFIKPQLMLLPVLVYLFSENPKVLWKLAALPCLMFAVSIMVFGLEWPVRWISNALHELPTHVWRLGSIDIWRFGIFLIPLPHLIKDRRKRLEAGLLASSLATPFFGVYSYTIFLLLNSKWWTLALSYAWFIGYYWFRESAIRFAWILPLCMLGVLLYETLAERRKVVPAA